MLFHLKSVSIFIPTSFDIMPGMLECCLLKPYFPPLWEDCNRKLYTLYNFEILQSTECKGLSKEGRLLMTLLGFVVFAGAQCVSLYSDVNKIWSAFEATLTISLHWRLKSIKMFMGGWAMMVGNTLVWWENWHLKQLEQLEFTTVWGDLQEPHMSTLLAACHVIWVCDNGGFLWVYRQRS